MTPRLRMSGIDKSFPGAKALRGVDLVVAAGEIHALVGENGSGKSTLVKILAAQQRADAGTVTIDGEDRDWHAPHDALNGGVSLIAQEPDLVPSLSVAENIFLGRMPTGRYGLVSWGAARRDARRALDELSVDISLDTPLELLRQEHQRLVEIARGVFWGRTILVLDEATSSLSDRGVERLFTVVRRAASRGVSVIFISHRLREITELADRATVLRDGEVVGTVEIAETDVNRLVAMMVGRELTEFYVRSERRADKRDLAVVEGVTSEPDLSNVSFTLGTGEVVGVAGLVGSGRSEIVETLFGLRSARAGTITLNGRRARIRNPGDAIRHGFAFVPAERARHGLVGDFSVRWNLTMSSWGSLTRWGIASARREQRLTEEYIGLLRIRTASTESPVKWLSGGNQQKVILARWLATEPRVFLLDEPTRGVDVGAKAEIYRLIDGLRQRQAAVLISSSDLLELLGVCDRILVMFRGSIVAELDARTTSEEEIAYYATGGTRDQITSEA